MGDNLVQLQISMMWDIWYKSGINCETIQLFMEKFKNYYNRKYR
jgi:hypothetical protein